MLVLMFSSLVLDVENGKHSSLHVRPAPGLVLVHSEQRICPCWCLVCHRYMIILKKYFMSLKKIFHVQTVADVLNNSCVDIEEYSLSSCSWQWHHYKHWNHWPNIVSTTHGDNTTICVMIMVNSIMSLIDIIIPHIINCSSSVMTMSSPPTLTLCLSSWIFWTMR